MQVLHENAHKEICAMQIVYNECKFYLVSGYFFVIQILCSMQQSQPASQPSVRCSKRQIVHICFFSFPFLLFIYFCCCLVLLMPFAIVFRMLNTFYFAWLEIDGNRSIIWIIWCCCCCYSFFFLLSI